MGGEKLRQLLRTRVRAFVGASATVAALWLVAVLAVNVFASSEAPGDRSHHLPKGVVRLPGDVLKVTGPKGVRLVLLHGTGGTPADLSAWHTVVQCLILVTLAALVVAGLDLLRRKRRRSRRVQVHAT